jgi:hypothetical protein
MELSTVFTIFGIIAVIMLYLLRYSASNKDIITDLVDLFNWLTTPKPKKGKR